MKYMGSKSRIAKYVIPIIQNYINENNIEIYIEPFVGGANIIDKIQCKNKIGSDLNKYLIALLSYVANNGKLYESVSKELYNEARTAFNTNIFGNFEDWQIGNIGFLASYNGRWFDGGYAKSGYENTKTGERYRDYYQEAKRNLLQQSNKLKDIEFRCCDYREYLKQDIANAVIYCDPPYENTKFYKNAINFDYEEFWQTMRQLSKNNIVIISELQAPNDFECIWEQEVSRSIKADGKIKVTEKLFVYKDNYLKSHEKSLLI